MIIRHGLLDGQVLQRLRNQTANATVTGDCDSDGGVRATIRRAGKTLPGWNRRKVGMARQRKFTARLAGIPVGGPYDIVLSIAGRATTGNAAGPIESITAHRIWVGDVWLLAGQSNMQGCGNLNKAPKPHPLVHAMYMDDHWAVAQEPIHFLRDSPDPVHYEAFDKQPLPKAERLKLLRAQVKGVSPAVFFGKEMVKRTGGVPQGLLCTAHGGTTMTQWDPAARHLGGRSLYGSMLRTWRKTGQPVAGMLWYQGESDAWGPASLLYSKRMKRFVAAIRRDLRQPGLPFLLVQIGKVFGLNWDMPSWNSIQAQQAALPSAIAKCEVVATIDLPMDDVVHIGSEGCARLGRRLARVADRLAHGNRKDLPAPALASISFAPRKDLKQLCTVPVTLTFRNVVGGLRAVGDPVGFSLLDENWKNLACVYKTTLKGNIVILETTLTQASEAFHLMYGHGLSPCVNITDARDMAIPVFHAHLQERKNAMSDFVNRWLVSSVQPATRPVHQLSAPKPHDGLGLRRLTFEKSFVDQHTEWENKSGHAYFFSEITLSEPMKLNVSVGFDGPIRVWIDDKPVVTSATGVNPAAPDMKTGPARLSQGKHRLAVAMDLRDGKSWGFFLRFERRDLTRKQIASNQNRLPVCSL